MNAAVWNRQLAVAFMMLVGLSACIAVPTRIGQESLLTEKQLQFIEVGSSTKEQVANAMSDHFTSNSTSKTEVTVTPLKFRNGDWWLYSQARKETKWAIVAIDGSGGTTGGNDYRFALIKFDAGGVVTDLELSSSEGNKCNDNGICVGDSFRPQVMAPIHDDRDAKQFAIPDNRCGVYVFGVPSTSNAQWKTLPIWISGHQVGLIVDGRQYFYFEVIPGVHDVEFANSTGSAKAKLNLDCRAGAAHILELVPGAKKAPWDSRTSAKVVSRGSLAGQTAIRRRHLTLTGS